MMKKFILLGLAISALTSCAQDDSDLTFSFTNSRASLIDGSASSCTQLVQSGTSGTVPAKDIPPKYFSLIAPVLSYKGKGKVLVFSIKIVMNSSGLQSGTYKCEISGDELSWIFGNGATPWNAQLDAGVSKTVNLACANLKCGSVLTQPNASFTATGNITVEGSEIDENGEENPIRATANVSVENRP